MKKLVRSFSLTTFANLLEEQPVCWLSLSLLV